MSTVNLYSIINKRFLFSFFWINYNGKTTHLNEAVTSTGAPVPSNGRKDTAQLPSSELLHVSPKAQKKEHGTGKLLISAAHNNLVSKVGGQ